MIVPISVWPTILWTIPRLIHEQICYELWWHISPSVWHWLKGHFTSRPFTLRNGLGLDFTMDGVSNYSKIHISQLSSPGPKPFVSIPKPKGLGLTLKSRSLDLIDPQSSSYWYLCFVMVYLYFTLVLVSTSPWARRPPTSKRSSL